MLHLLDRALVTRLVQHVRHALHRLLRLLQSVDEHDLLLLQQLRLVIRLVRVVHFLLDAHLVTILDVLRVFVGRLDPLLLGHHAFVPSFLKLRLLFFQVGFLFLVNHLVNLLLLTLDRVVRVLIRLPHLVLFLSHSLLRFLPFFFEPLSILILLLLTLLDHLGLGLVSARLFLVHLDHKLVLLLQLFDAFIRFLFLEAEANDPIVYLLLLIFLFLSLDNCAHHFVFRLLGGNGTNTGSQILVLLRCAQFVGLTA